MSISACIDCLGLGSICNACREALDECMCGPDAEPTPCLTCNGDGREPPDPYAGETAEVSDAVTWKDPARADEWENLTVISIDARRKTLTCRGWFGEINRIGHETHRTRRLPMAQCSVSRRTS